jgi:hypothetical protein
MDWKRLSIFGSGSVPIVVTARVSKSISPTEVAHLLEQNGAILTHCDDQSGAVVVDLPVGRFVGIGYPRRLTLSCRITVEATSTREAIVSSECDAAPLRASKRRLFYFLSLAFGSIGVSHMLTNGWDIGTMVFMGLPWPAVEADFFYDRWRLLQNMQRCLRQLGAEHYSVR